VSEQCCLGQKARNQKSQAQPAPAQPAPAQQAPAQGNTSAQPELKTEDISDAELKQFVQASAKAAAVQQESQMAMVAVVEEEKLTVEKFTEMAKAHQEQKLGEVKASPEEKAAFSKAAQRIMDMQPQIEQSMQQAIEKEGITLEKFEQIMLAYQQNAAVQARVQKLIDQKP
jgi:hypothetical protein